MSDTSRSRPRYGTTALLFGASIYLGLLLESHVPDSLARPLAWVVLGAMIIAAVLGLLALPRPNPDQASQEDQP